MVVTARMRLERMLLHSGATSSVNPGICTNMPSCVAGTLVSQKSRCAACTEPCCKRRTITFKANSGSGTSQNKKQRGKLERRKARVPKHSTKAAIDQSTKESIFSVSSRSEGRAGDFDLFHTVIRT